MDTDKRYVLIGLGSFGREIARTLNDRGADLIVIDKDPALVSQLKAEGFKYTVNIDNLDIAALSKFIKPEDVTILSMGDNFESTILTIEILKEIGVKTIYARVIKDIQYKVLEKMDITEIVFPEKQEGRRFALRLLNWDINFIDDFNKETYLIEVPVTDKLAGSSVLDLKLRSHYNVNIIALKSQVEDEDKHEKQKIVYVGFETTTPATAVAVQLAYREQIDNFCILSAHKLVVPAMQALLGGRNDKIDAFLCPGHVSVIIGSDAYRPVAEQFNRPCVVAGFEPLQIIEGIVEICSQLQEGKARVDSVYHAAVHEQGNPVALKVMDRCFEPWDGPWRGLGIIPGGTLWLRKEYEKFSREP